MTQGRALFYVHEHDAGAWCARASLTSNFGPASAIVELRDDVALGLDSSFKEGLGFRSPRGCGCDVGLKVLHT